MTAGIIPIREYVFLHESADVPFQPDKVTDTDDGEVFEWNWNSVFDSAIDVRLTLECRAFVGAVTVGLRTDARVRDVMILADGKPAGKISARTGEDFGGSVTVPVGVKAEIVTVRLYGNLKKIALTLPEVLGAAEDGFPLIWPTPLATFFSGGGSISLKTVLPVHPENSDEAFAASFLTERLTERFGDWRDENGVTVTVTTETENFADEEYLLAVENEGVLLCARKRLPLLWAADVLLQIAVTSAGGPRFPCGSVSDRPYKPMRGFHMYLPPREQIPFVKRLFRYVLVPLRYNQLIMEFAGGMRFDRHPEISEKWLEGNERAAQGLQPAFPHGGVAGGKLLEKDEVRGLLDDARSYGIEIIPEVQSFGHTQYITYAHPEIAEREEQTHVVGDTRGEDARPASFYAHCYCPSNEESYRIIYDIIDEIVEVARPERFVHMGHDEIYQVGICPHCKGKNHADLYYRHVSAVHDHLVEKGLRMMIWCDMMQPTERYKTFPAITRLPRDIVLLDFIWYFHFDIDMEDNLLPYGYEVMMGNLYSSHYPRYESRAAKEHMVGGEVSTWCTPNEYNYGKKGKFWDLAYTAEMLWNEDYDHRLRPWYSHVIAERIQPLERAEIRGTYSPASPSVRELSLPAGDAGTVPAALRAVCPTAILADNVTMTVDACADRLIFCHAAIRRFPRIAWQPLHVLGSYTVVYDDGTSADYPVEYAGNAMIWTVRYGEPLPQQYYRHQGYVATWSSDPVTEAKTEEGGDVLVLGAVWDNPEPGKKIVSVTYSPAEPGALVLTGIRTETR